MSLSLAIFEYQILSSPRLEVIFQILQCPNLHCSLRLLSFSAHVRKQCDVAEFHQTCVHIWFVRIDIKACRVQLWNSLAFWSLCV